uniref:Uncharacterized protein n=1 Tax=uncultured marine virus TaxID=186617 RepID=A0A0F7L749_9VIRU|nr:hypothetical protein [uncultured marine virus]
MTLSALHIHAVNVFVRTIQQCCRFIEKVFVKGLLTQISVFWVPSAINSTRF